MKFCQILVQHDKSFTHFSLLRRLITSFRPFYDFDKLKKVQSVDFH